MPPGRGDFFLPRSGEGSHTITANTAGGSSSLTFTLDRSLATPTIGLAHDTGTSASDHITSDATLTGTTDAGAAVAVYDLTGFILGSSPPVLLATVTGLLTGLSGADRRIGFYRYNNEGLYRGDMLTHCVAYNPHIHIAKNFIALINALLAETPTVPIFEDYYLRQRTYTAYSAGIGGGA